MRVISKLRLKQFWRLPGCADAEGPLQAWHTRVNHRSVDWLHWSDIKADYATASIVGSCVVFNIGGNKYRLITRILYPSHKVFVLRVMTHQEYDRNQWQADCGCYRPPPRRRAVSGMIAKQLKQSRNDR